MSETEKKSSCDESGTADERVGLVRFGDLQLAVSVAKFVDVARGVGNAEGDAQKSLNRICDLLAQADEGVIARFVSSAGFADLLRYPAQWTIGIFQVIEQRSPGAMAQAIANSSVGARADFMRRIAMLEWLLPFSRLKTLTVALSEYRSARFIYEGEPE